MTEVDMTRPHHYEQCDIPEGMTLVEYRAAKRAAGKGRKTGLVAKLRRRRDAAPRLDVQRRAA
jgi:hypothetical protein